MPEDKRASSTGNRESDEWNRSTIRLNSRSLRIRCLDPLNLSLSRGDGDVAALLRVGRVGQYLLAPIADGLYARGCTHDAPHREAARLGGGRRPGVGLV